MEAIRSSCPAATNQYHKFMTLLRIRGYARESPCNSNCRFICRSSFDQSITKISAEHNAIVRIAKKKPKNRGKNRLPPKWSQTTNGKVVKLHATAAAKRWIWMQVQCDAELKTAMLCQQPREHETAEHSINYKYTNEINVCKSTSADKLCLHLNRTDDSAARKWAIAFCRLQCYNLCYFVAAAVAPVAAAAHAQHTAHGKRCFNAVAACAVSRRALAREERKKNPIGNNHLIGLSVYNNRRAREKSAARRSRWREEKKMWILCFWINVCTWKPLHRWVHQWMKSKVRRNMTKNSRSNDWRANNRKSE